MPGPVGDPRTHARPSMPPRPSAPSTPRAGDDEPPPIGEEDLPGGIPVVARRTRCARRGRGRRRRRRGLPDGQQRGRGRTAPGRRLPHDDRGRRAVPALADRRQRGRLELPARGPSRPGRRAGEAPRRTTAAYNSTEVMEGSPPAQRDGLSRTPRYIATLERHRRPSGSRHPADRPRPRHGTPDVAFDLRSPVGRRRGGYGTRPPRAYFQASWVAPTTCVTWRRRYKTVRWTMPRAAPTAPGRWRTRARDRPRRERLDRRRDAAARLETDLGLRLVAACALYARPDPTAVVRVAEQALSTASRSTSTGRSRRCGAASPGGARH